MQLIDKIKEIEKYICEHFEESGGFCHILNLHLPRKGIHDLFYLSWQQLVPNRSHLVTLRRDPALILSCGNHQRGRCRKENVPSSRSSTDSSLDRKSVV